jgi:phosphotriesterase-related protein
VASLITTLGPRTAAELGRILPHEHVFVDLRTWRHPGHGEADTAEVVEVMSPYLRDVQRQGVTAIVEPGPIGVGRRVDILSAVSQAVGIPLVAPTGVYREQWIPPAVREASTEALRDLFVAELTDQIEDTRVRAGWIKIGASDEGITEAEGKVLRAAVAASISTGATIGSHTVNGAVAREQLDIIERAGGRPDRFVWIHAHAEPDRAVHLELARRGCWVELDGIGDPAQDQDFVDMTRALLDAGFAESVLLSQDRGWFDPARPRGGTPLPYTALFDRFIPLLADSGVDEQTITTLTCHNPFRAFAR